MIRSVSVDCYCSHDNIVDEQRLAVNTLHRKVSQNGIQWDERNSTEGEWGREGGSGGIYFYNGSHLSSKKVSKSTETAETVIFKCRGRRLWAEF